ncbi:hypothetical protein DFH09DRAFT_290196 [Mycena vulgaris]|nr:hypothetical protein DFH09DRAFT_290196 [Mycena vulgaris]
MVTQRLTGRSEGRPRGGGGSRSQGASADHSEGRRQNRCSGCHQPGHNITSCPWGRAV